MTQSDIGVYGLGVMGSNLALNLEEKGYRVSVYNRSTPGEEKLMEDFINVHGKNKQFRRTASPEEFVRSIQTPRKILIMVKAGKPVDDIIDQLLSYLDKSDILIDGGNSHFSDTTKRVNQLESKGIHFIGMGVSGGEEGARHGPSLMPGGAPKGWEPVRQMLISIAATAPDGSPCCSWMGTGGAGHFVKMVHNGIEYADMQLIAESYHLMKEGLKMDFEEISVIFKQWNDGDLNSYLLEITAEILTVKDNDGAPLVEKILDAAGQKGTGKWMARTALDLGVPLPGITEAVFARFISGFVSLREKASAILSGPDSHISEDKEQVIESLRQALFASRIMALSEGFFLITNSNDEMGWNINPSTVAKTWRAGCIIRSVLLETVASAYETTSGLEHLLLNSSISEQFKKLQQGWRDTTTIALKHGIPIPAVAAAINQYDSFRSMRLPANLIQAQRDYFGAHTYERKDKPRGTFLHTDWQKLSG